METEKEIEYEKQGHWSVLLGKYIFVTVEKGPTDAKRVECYDDKKCENFDALMSKIEQISFS